MVAAYTNGWWPSNFDGSTVQGTIVGLDGAPIVGAEIAFAATPDSILDYSALKKIVPRGLKATTDANGFFSIVLPATDDPDVSPTGFTYTVSEGWVGGRTYSIAAPKGVVQDLVNVTPQPSANGVPIVRGPKGDAGSVTQVAGQSPDSLGRVDLSGVVMQRYRNLSDVADPVAARASLGLGSIATHDIAELTNGLSGKLAKASNLADLADPVAARSNLGLGSLAVMPRSALSKGVLGAPESNTDVTLSGGFGTFQSCPADCRLVIPALDAAYNRQIDVYVSVLVYGNVLAPALYRFYAAFALGATSTSASMVTATWGPTCYLRLDSLGASTPKSGFGSFVLPAGQGAVVGFAIARVGGGDPTDYVNYSTVMAIDRGALAS